MAKKIVGIVGEAAIRTCLTGEPDRQTRDMAARYLLQVLADSAPGGAVEVRVPPVGAVQAVEGPAHSRGTPPNVVETDPDTWIALATGGLAWAEAVRDGRVSASGSRADLSPLLPVVWDSAEQAKMES